MVGLLGISIDIALLGGDASVRRHRREAEACEGSALEVMRQSFHGDNFHCCGTLVRCLGL